MTQIVELPYSLRDRYKSIAVAWTVIIIPPVFLNIGLFYGLWARHEQRGLDPIFVLTLPTAILGVFTVIAIVERVWKLIRASPKFRPLNSPRYALDIFQWGYFAILIAISALVTTTLARDDTDHDGHRLQLRLLSLPTSVLMFLVATLTLVSLVLNRSGWKLPFRFGSLGAGNVLRPAAYYIVEDVVAVDGNGGAEYRQAFGARYDGSLVFREMIWNVSLAWMLFFYAMAALFTILVFALPAPAVYAVGWAGPFPLAGVMAMATISYVRLMLRREKEGLYSEETTPLLQ